ncbi:DUF1992 domain-containing protein [Kineosporia sp. R_H_3]|uniref:DnaJ family domain-containing protein n=1 Tax=Kineosporia sp. R_H_3 TaxID=1961848 RepID=UPI000B4A64C7|nr:DUF1992 domain-containing protein [Kineosporia sp. R_H_3]
MEWGRPSVEDTIRAAIARGEFDDLPGKGKPLRLSDVNDPDWWVKAYLKRENIDTSVLVHPTIALRREADTFPGSLVELTTPDQVRAVLADYNRRVVEEWRRPAVGPTVPVAARQVDVEAMVGRWQALRDERAAAERARQAAPDGAGPEKADDRGGREAARAGRRSWWRRLLGLR